jgi:hypothetical protein
MKPELTTDRTMITNRPKYLAMLLAFSLCLVGAMNLAPFGAAESQAEQWSTFYVAGTPISVKLPTVWEAQAPDKTDKERGFRIWLRAPSNVAWLGVLTGRVDDGWASFQGRILRDVRVRVFAEDPHATVRTRVTSLPAGHAVESIVAYSQKSPYPGERAIYYDLLSHGVQYEFEYLCPSNLVGTYLPVFTASARTIQVTK